MIKWLFFDLGSTLIDEGECEQYRIDKLLAQENAPGREVLLRTMQDFAEQNIPPYKYTAKKFRLETIKWPGHLEKLYDSVPDVLESLSKKYRIGIIANQNTGTEERLRIFGIRQYFDVIASSAELGFAKPDPEIFHAALKAAECKPENAVMIGDRLDNDIEPAGKLGMHTMWIKQGPFKFGNIDLITCRPDYVADRISDILNFL